MNTHDDQTNLKKQLAAEAGLSNRILSDVEEKAVQELLSDAQRYSDELDKEISRIQPILDELLHRRQKNVARMMRFKVATSVQKRLPPEILSNIFVLCLDGPAVSLPPQFHLVPWVFGRVCSRWRQIALNEPRLWKQLRIDNHHAARQHHISTLARSILSWSGRSPISLACKSRHYGGTMVDLVTSHSTRIEDLSLTLDIKSYVSLFTLPPGTLNRLKSLILEFYMEPVTKIEDELKRNPITVFGAAPDLRKVAFRICGGGQHIQLLPETLIHLPWSQLTNITFSSISPTSTVLLQILAQCTNLVELEASLSDKAVLSKTADVQLPTDTVLLNLRSINLDIKPGCQSLPRFLSFLAAPSLKNFKVNCTMWNFQWPQHEFMSFLHRSNCALESLSMKSVSIPPDDYEHLFAALPGLTTLAFFDGSPLPNSVVNAMTSGDILPAIEDIQCWMPSLNPLLDLLESRWHGGIPGRYVGIKRATISVDDFRHCSRRLRSLEPTFSHEGRDITITGHRDL